MTAAGTHRYHLPLANEDVEVVSAHLWAAGAIGVLEHPDELVAWFPVPDVPRVPPGGRWVEEPDRDWQADWKASLRPMRAGRFVIVPTWCVDDHTARAGDITLVLDPGRAFGSGDHATTLLCLEALDALDLPAAPEPAPDAPDALDLPAAPEPTPWSVADVGCGSGILAIAAAARGARVVAVDIDPDAVAVTEENARRNGVDIDVRAGSVDRLDAPVDVVVANLVTDVVLALTPALVAATRRTLIVSGVSSGRVDEATAAITAAGLSIVASQHRDGWAVVVADRTQVANAHDGRGGWSA